MPNEVVINVEDEKKEESEVIVSESETPTEQAVEIVAMAEQLAKTIANNDQLIGTLREEFTRLGNSISDLAIGLTSLTEVITSRLDFVDTKLATILVDEKEEETPPPEIIVETPVPVPSVEDNPPPEKRGKRKWL